MPLATGPYGRKCTILQANFAESMFPRTPVNKGMKKGRTLEASTLSLP